MLIIKNDYFNFIFFSLNSIKFADDLIQTIKLIKLINFNSS